MMALVWRKRNEYSHAVTDGIRLSYGTNQISDKQGELVLGKLAQGTVKQDFEVQASLYWQPVFSPWRFGMSYLDSDFIYLTSDNDDLFFDEFPSVLTKPRYAFIAFNSSSKSLY